MTASRTFVAVAVLFVGSLAAFADDATTKSAGESKPVTTASGLTIIDKSTDASASVAKAGDEVWVHYTGRLQSNGTKFDSSLDRGEPINFKLGAGNVIKGWDEGIAGMSIGQKRQLIIPADLGYGNRGAGASIPPGATLVFDVELVGLKRG